MKKTAKIYVSLAFISLAALLATLYVSGGSYIPRFFFRDESDTGMDFFNSLAEAASYSCYIVYHTLYPPFANEVFHDLAHLLPCDIRYSLPQSHQEIVDLRCTAGDLRCHQASLLLFIFFIMAYYAMVISVIIWRFRDNVKAGILLSLAALSSCGSLTAMERGNIVMYSMLFTMVFLFGYDSESRGVRWLAFASLAVAASLKLYPAAYGLMVFLIKDHKDTLLQVIHTILLSLDLSLLPMLHFGGVQGLALFFDSFFGFNADPSGEDFTRYGMKGIASHFSSDLYNKTGINIGVPSALSSAMLAISLILLLSAFLIHLHFGDNGWLAAFDITLAIVLVQPKSTDYTLSFFVPVILMMISEEDSLKLRDIPVFIMLLIFVLPYPTTPIRDAIDPVLHHVDIIQSALILSVGYDFAACLKRIISALINHTHHGHFMHHGPQAPGPAYA